MSNPLSPSQASRLRRGLSPERLGPYERACGDDIVSAIALYEWNGAVSAGFHEDLGVLEVVLRNALHDQLMAWHLHRHGASEWWDDPAGILEARGHQDVVDAGFRIRRDGRIITPGRVVAELTFGFWRYLLSRRYETSLWTPTLRHAFPGLRPARRATVYDPVNRLVRLRNRIAHHEPIHNRPLERMHADLLRVAGYLDSDVRAWIQERSRVPRLLLSRPVTGVPVPREPPESSARPR
ncbi:hypothetical protein [Protofrankia coriariae]|uniref:Abi-like protein n=1 Tax=Protofrankia coriariae TaxID=1562887 RepID=A0ABR5F8E1_9ACTN|nr:hypothetical protein [Protofrankia coriariae]KLL12992.1 hypothetical protein FrCorBMG51_00035 [Protofrankia coriariae]